MRRVKALSPFVFDEVLVYVAISYPMPWDGCVQRFASIDLLLRQMPLLITA